MDAYVQYSGDVKTITTKAKHDVALALAKSDLLRGQTFFYSFSILNRVYRFKFFVSLLM